MISACTDEVYRKVKFHVYKDVCNVIDENDTLTLPELFCVDLIYSMGSPTVKEFAEFIHVSSPDASYKIKNLVTKGYVEKVRSEIDKREYHLVVTDKYFAKSRNMNRRKEEIKDKIRERFSNDDINKMEEVLNYIKEIL